MKIKQMCCYKGKGYNILPAVLVSPKDDGFIIALKWWNFHVGVYLTHQKKLPEYPEGEVVGPCICGSWPGGACFKCPKTG